MVGVGDKVMVGVAAGSEMAVALGALVGASVALGCTVGRAACTAWVAVGAIVAAGATGVDRAAPMPRSAKRIPITASSIMPPIPPMPAQKAHFGRERVGAAGEGALYDAFELEDAPGTGKPCPALEAAGGILPAAVGFWLGAGGIVGGVAGRAAGSLGEGCQEAGAGMLVSETVGDPGCPV
jgi:hypothetical protein